MKNLKIIKSYLFVLMAGLVMLSSCSPNPEEVATETCNCFESIIGDKLFSQEDVKYHRDSCLNLIKAKYNTENDEKLRNELKLYDRQINSAVVKVKNAYNAQIEKASERIANAYIETTSSNWWISDNLHNGITDSIGGLIKKWYGVNTNNEVIQKALNLDVVEDAKSNFERKFQNQAFKSMNLLVELDKESKDFKRGERLLFHMYIGAKYEDVYLKTGEKFVKGYAVWVTTENDYLIGRKVDKMFGDITSEEKEYESLKSYNSAAKMSYDYYVNCDDLNTDISDYVDSELLLIGNLVDYKKVVEWFGYSKLTYYFAEFENCELIGVYDNQQISKEAVYAWDEYTTYLKSNAINIPDRNIEITKNSTIKEKPDNNLNISNCNKFLEGYEKFMIEYISIIKKYKANPTDASILVDYTKMLTEASKWSNYDEECANDPAFVGKIAEIQMKIAKAAGGF